MATSPFSSAHDVRLKVLNKVKQGLVGQSTSIILLTKNRTTGALDELLTLDGNWSKESIRPTFTGRADEAVASYREEFQISASALDLETARRIAAIQHGDRIYKVETPIEPKELQQYWKVVIIQVASQ